VRNKFVSPRVWREAVSLEAFGVRRMSDGTLTRSVLASVVAGTYYE